MNSQNITHHQDIETLLRSVIPQADKKFQQQLEEKLLTQLAAIYDERKSNSMRQYLRQNSG